MKETEERIKTTINSLGKSIKAHEEYIDFLSESKTDRFKEKKIRAEKLKINAIEDAIHLIHELHIKTRNTP